MDPPDILLTTPESLALMLSYEQAPQIFGSLKRVVLDELHALAENKRGDQLMLCLARLRTLAPGVTPSAASIFCSLRLTTPRLVLPASGDATACLRRSVRR